MTSSSGVVVTIPADVQMIDETGYVWTFLHEAVEPDRVFPGALIAANEQAPTQPNGRETRGTVGVPPLLSELVGGGSAVA